MIPWICVALLAIGYPLVWWRLRWRLAAQQLDHERARTVLTEQLAAVSVQVELARDQLGSAQAQARVEALAVVAVELSAAQAVAQAERDKSSRYFAKCTDFENERNEFQRLYTAQSIGHGNAQNLMMQTIEHLAQQLQAKGVRAQIPKVLHIVREDFREQHEMPARALVEQTRETLNPAAAAPEPALVAATSD